MPHSANTEDVSLLDVLFLWHLQQKLNLNPRNLTDNRLICGEITCADEPQRLIHFYLMQTEMRSFGSFSNKITFRKTQIYFFFWTKDFLSWVGDCKIYLKINPQTEKWKREHLLDKLETRSGLLSFLKNAAKIKISACKMIDQPKLGGDAEKLWVWSQGAVDGAVCSTWHWGCRGQLKGRWGASGSWREDWMLFHATLLSLRLILGA